MRKCLKLFIPFTVVKENISDLEPILKIFEDPVRFKIYTEIYFKGEVTANDLLETLDINRSTLSFHLTKLVKQNILEVRTNPTGRPIKHYSFAKQFIKVEIVGGEGTNEDELIRMLKLKMQQLSLEYKLATNMANQNLSEMINSNNLKQIKINASDLSFIKNDKREHLINGGIFYTTEEHYLEFISELNPILEKFRNTIHSHSKNNKMFTHAVFIGGMPLQTPRVVKIKRLKTNY